MASATTMCLCARFSLEELNSDDNRPLVPLAMARYFISWNPLPSLFSESLTGRDNEDTPLSLVNLRSDKIYSL